MDNIEIRDISGDEIVNSYYLITQSYLDLTKEEYAITVKEMMELSNFKMIGAFVDKKIIGISGYVISRISNLIIDKEYRNKRIGTKMIYFLEEKARNNNCKHVILDSFIGNKKSHSLYFREDFFIRGFHFMKEL